MKTKILIAILLTSSSLFADRLYDNLFQAAVATSDNSSAISAYQAQQAEAQRLEIERQQIEYLRLIYLQQNTGQRWYQLTPSK